MSRIILASSMARAGGLGSNDRAALEERAADLGVTVIVTRSVRRDAWKVVVSSGSQHTTLFGQGPMAAVIAGALCDFEALPDAAFDDDPEPVDLNSEGDPAWNGAFG